MSRSRSWVPRLLVESAVVVFSILAALAADAWWQGRQARGAVEASLESIRSELAGNLNRLQRVAPYHRTLADTLRALGAAGVEEVDPDLYSQGWLITPELTAAAWEGARATGTTTDMTPGMVRTLAEAYQSQSQYLARREAIIPVLYGTILETGDPDLSRAYRPVAGIIGDVAAWEELLLDQYERVLNHWPGQETIRR